VKNYLITSLSLILGLSILSSCQHAQNTLTNPNMVQPQNSNPIIEDELVYYSDSTLIDSVARAIFARTNFDRLFLDPKVDSLVKLQGIPDTLFYNINNYNFTEMLDEWGQSFPFKRVIFLADPTNELAEYLTEPLIISVGGAVYLRYPNFSRPPNPDKPYEFLIRLYTGLIFSDRLKFHIRKMQQSESSATGKGK